MFNSKSYSKYILVILSGFLILYSKLEANQLPIPVGPVQRISPIPGPENPDPILANLIPVMNEWFQKPYYPGDPNPLEYLKDIFLQTNTYGWRRGNRLIFNPIDDKIVVTFIRQNYGRDNSFTLIPGFIGTYTTARSKDGGKSWHYGPPVVPPIPLGGNLSQCTVNIQGYNYAKNGRIYTFSELFDLHPNPPKDKPTQRLVFNYSDDNGKSWSAPLTVVENPEETFLNEVFFDAVGTVVSSPALTVSPSNSDLVYVSYTKALAPDYLYGDYFYKISRNGKTFSEEKKLYNMINDPLWVKNHFDPDFTSDPTYFLFGGQCLAESPGIVPVDQNVLIFPINRYYPKIGSTTYTQEVSDSNTDIAVVRSLDNGRTWLPVAGEIEQYIFPFTHDPAGVNPDTGSQTIVQNGATNFSTAVSPYTGRIYIAYLAANPAADPDPEIAQFFSYVLLSSSTDKGATWSHPVQINLTPTNISFDNQQAFAPSMMMTKDGSLVVGYYDFRNYNGGNDRTSFLQTDAWLAVYKETSEACGGSTGLGLDVVGELRLTPSSFNNRISPQSVASPIGLSVNNNNVLFATFTMTNENDPSKINKNGYLGMTIDTNNRLNVFLQRYQFPKPGNE